MTTPNDRRYTAEHLWARLESDGSVTAGITAHAQEELGDIVYVQAPEVGRIVKRGEPCGAIESVKSLSDLHAPVSGEVIAVNADTADRPERVNTDPYETWLFRVRPTTPGELDTLLDAVAYDRLAGQGGQ